MQLSIPLALLSACAVTVLAGCEPNQLYITSRTVVGVNAAVNPELTQGAIFVGYDRAYATVIPRSVKTQDERTKAQKQEAMTSLACSRLAVEGITIRYFTESIATGEAARKFAENLGNTNIRNVEDFFDCFKDKKGKPNDPAAANVGGSRS
jgi:hypothetical protein